MFDIFKQHGIKIAAIGSLSALVLYTALRGKIFAMKSISTENQLSQQKFQTVQNNQKIVRICLTGGPCGGKTTGMTKLYQSLQKQFSTYIVPQAATLIADSGGMISTSSYNDDQLLQFQYNLLNAQILLQSSFVQIASNQQINNVAVILCDRGLMDGKAYMKQSQWERMLQKFNMQQKKIRDQRYDAVFHLVTAADGAEQYYSTLNNSARHQTIQEARQLDSHTRQAWFGHPKLSVIDNKTTNSFDEKLDLLVKQVKEIVHKKRDLYLRSK